MAESILILLVSGCLYGRFVKFFFNNNRSCIIVGASFFLTLLILYLIPYEMLGMAADAAGMVVIFVVMYLLDRRNVRQKLFLTMVMYLVGWFTHGVTAVFRDILFSRIMYSQSVLSKSAIDYFSCFLLTEGVCLIMRFSLMAFLLYVIDRIYSYKKEDLTAKELALMVSTPLSSIVGYAAFTFFSESYLNDTRTYITEVYHGYDWIKALYQMLSFAAIFSAIVFYQKIKDGYRKEKESVVLYEQMENMKKHIAEVEALYGDIRGLKHDMGNHVMILENLCRRNQQREAIAYLSGLREEFHEIAEEVKSGNPVTDVIIEEKKKAAFQKGIPFSSRFIYPKEAQINAFDVSIILNNGLDNALEGAQSCREPYVKVSSYQENNAYMIEIENSFNGAVQIDEETGMPATTKEDKEQHGYGFANIRRVAGKYFGDISIQQEEGRFLLRVMLMLK
ncbi:MAG: GHKL domain-containing protein [Lachnospiraceae bacterium]|nr:GHKL domain-containing protein [Lachnospiraceae bacterium]